MCSAGIRSPRHQVVPFFGGREETLKLNLAQKSKVVYHPI